MLAVHHHLKYTRIFIQIIFIILNIFSCDCNPIEPVASDHVDDDIQRDSDDLLIPTENVFRNDTIQKKIYIIIVILSLCISGAIILSFVNIHDDFMELSNFYRGYMGRRLMIQERRLVYRGQGDKITKMQAKKKREKSEDLLNNGRIQFIQLEEDFSAASSPRDPYPGEEDTLCSLPGMVRYVEDEGREWRELDYFIEVGNPPTSFCSFLRQYDWNIFTMDELTDMEMQLRKNLLNQFRQWKKRKRKNFNIFVTERARREMADQDEQKNKKRTPNSN